LPRHGLVGRRHGQDGGGLEWRGPGGGRGNAWSACDRRRGGSSRACRRWLRRREGGGARSWRLVRRDGHRSLNGLRHGRYRGRRRPGDLDERARL
jgi:hypothetical protein